MSPEMQSDLVGAGILTGAFLVLLVAAEAWRRLGDPKAEWTRKLVHLGGGILCLFFPFLLRSPWIVLVLTVGMSAVFACAARLGFLECLHGIERSSRGAEYYPLAIFLVFLLTPGRPWLYLAAVLVLAVGDAFAALIGSHYGVVRYEVENDEKSLEGSLVFLVIAFLAIHLPVLLLTDLPRETSVLAALLVAILVTGFEAISLRGTDNLFVPLAVVFVLGKITTKPFSEIVFQNLSLAAICLAMALLVRRLPYFNVGATIVMTLYAYANWSLGSWMWALPVFGGLTVLLAVRTQAGPPLPRYRIRVRGVARAVLPPFGLLLAANLAGAPGRLFGPYLAASAVVLSFTLANPVLKLERSGRRARLVGVTGTALLALAATMLTPWLIQARSVSPLLLAVYGAIVWLATYVLLELEGRRPEESVNAWTAARFAFTLLVAGAVLLLQAAGLVPRWFPL